MEVFNGKNFTYLRDVAFRQCEAFVFLMGWNSFCCVEVHSFKNVREVISGEGWAHAHSGMSEHGPVSVGYTWTRIYKCWPLCWFQWCCINGNG